MNRWLKDSKLRGSKFHAVTKFTWEEFAVIKEFCEQTDSSFYDYMKRATLNFKPLQDALALVLSEYIKTTPDYDKIIAEDAGAALRASLGKHEKENKENRDATL